MPVRHQPVLLKEAIAHLDVRTRGCYIDATFGAGGYTDALLAAGAGRVVAIDRDESAIAEGAPMVATHGERLDLCLGRFSDLEDIIHRLGVEAVDGVVFDIGVSSMHLERPERGFSFLADGPLDMRMGAGGPTAGDIVNTYGEADLKRIIAVLGEERRAAAVARAIVAARRDKAITGTLELAAIVERALGRSPRGERIHPATRTFQALRIFVNGELEELAGGLAAAERVLKPGGRLVIVTFHSLEDRIVKRFLRQRGGLTAAPSRHAPATDDMAAASFRVITRKPVRPGEGEVAANPRARSARLRAGERTSAPALAAPVEIGDIPVLDEAA